MSEPKEDAEQGAPQRSERPDLLQNYTRESLNALLDNVLTPEEKRQVEQAVEEHTPHLEELAKYRQLAFEEVKLGDLGFECAKVLASRMSQGELKIGQEAIKFALDEETGLPFTPFLYPGSLKGAPFDEKTGGFLKEPRLAYFFPITRDVRIVGEDFPKIPSRRYTVTPEIVNAGILIYPNRVDDRIHLWQMPGHDPEPDKRETFPDFETAAKRVEEILEET